MNKKILLVALLFPLLAIAQHTIKGTFSPAEDYKWAILYKVTSSSAFYTADTKVDEEGKFTIELDSSVTKGVYRLVYALPQEVYNFDIIYNGEEDIELTFNVEEGANFISSKENKLLTSYEQEMAIVLNEIISQYQKEDIEKKTILELFEVQASLQQTFEAESEGALVGHFIRANRTYIPTQFEDFSTYAKNRQDHYFKNVDFNNSILQKSAFPLEYSLNYITGFVNTSEEPLVSYRKNIDVLTNFLKQFPENYQKDLSSNLWQRLVNEEHDGAANYLAESYLIKLATSLNDTELAQRLTLFKNTSIGSIAPDFSWKEDIEGKTVATSLHEIDRAENYIIIFWSSNCSHCLTEVPEIHAKLKNSEKNKYKVIAIGLEDEPYDWQNKVFDFPDFINVLGLGKWENEIGNKYDVSATPTYFVLDKDKKIIAKPYDYKALIAYIKG